MALDRQQVLKGLLLSLIKLSDDGMYGTIEIKMENGTPQMTSVKRQYKHGEMEEGAPERLQELLGDRAA